MPNWKIKQNKKYIKSIIKLRTFIKQWKQNINKIMILACDGWVLSCEGSFAERICGCKIKVIKCGIKIIIKHNPSQKWKKKNKQTKLIFLSIRLY